MQVIRALDSDGKSLSDIEIAKDKKDLEVAYHERTANPEDPADAMKTLLFGCDVTLANGHKYKMKAS